jgi:hypothetical protein
MIEFVPMAIPINIKRWHYENESSSKIKQAPNPGQLRQFLLEHDPS